MNKRGRTGFDLVLKAQAACRGRSVGLFKSSDQKTTANYEDLALAA
jgi:hypothetical protein